MYKKLHWYMPDKRKSFKENVFANKLEAQSSTLYIYYIYIELACTQSPFFQNLPY